MFTYAAYNAAPAELAAAAPAELAASAQEEGEWYRLLRAEPLIGGLELGFLHGLHPHGIERLSALLDPGWRNIATTMPHTLAAVDVDPAYGLASADADGRRRAVDDVAQLRDEVFALREALGPLAVTTVELQCAPSAAAGAAGSTHLAASLTEIAGWDWSGVRLLVEHSDAATPTHAPAKGWLSLDEEIDAVRTASARTGAPIGQAVNWGRSVIETRAPRGAVEHLERLRTAGTLCGFTVSGVSGQPTSRSLPWEDVHLAIADVDPESLLTTAALVDAVAVARRASPLQVGVKVGAPAAPTTLEERLAPGLATLHALADAWAHVDAGP